MKTKIIENYILEKIQQELYVSKIETEDQLSDHFNMSKITVRNAINNLVNRGVLRKVQGSGVFVAPHDEDKIHVNMDLIGFRERAKIESKKASSSVLSLKKITPPNFIVKKMNLQTVWYYERVNFFDGEAMAYEEGYVRTDLFPQLTEQVLEISKYKYYREKNLPPYKIERTVLPIVVTSEISKLLKLQGNPPLIAIESNTYAEDGAILDVTTTFYNPDKFSIKSSCLIK